MPTKAERILENLPRSFLPARGRSALTAVSGAVGGELQRGEVSLARILRAHWVDSADENATRIDDLARIASMWGLAPLRDADGSQLETVEQFREHLKRHVRSMLEGRVTVRGLLQVAAETLGIHIAEGDAVDVWWTRPSPSLIGTERRGDDAAERVFGREAVEDWGADAQPATVRGTVNLTAGANLEAGALLKLQVDGAAARVIDLGAGVDDLRAVSLEHIVDAINAVVPDVASGEVGVLVLRSIRTGPSGRLELEDVDGDAARAVLGVPAHIYTGQDPRAATMRSALDLSGGVDLSRDQFLRLTVDGTRTVEVDCADPAAPGATLLDRIRDAVNEALGTDIATHDNQFLTLSSSLEGSSGSVFVQKPAAQDCAARVFGDATRFAVGSDARPASVTSARDLSGGVDLSERAMVRIGLDGAHPVAVNCAGAEPAKTTIEELVTTFNAAFGPGFARTDGRVLTFTSRVAGRKGELIFGAVDEGDALEDVLGFGPRVFTGTAAVPASITSSVDLSGGADLLAGRAIGLIVDDKPMQEIVLPIPELTHPDPPALPAEDIRRTDLASIVAAINAAVRQDIASRTDTQLILTSTDIGAHSRLAVVPLEREVRRRFVSRAAVLDEAAMALFGFVQRHAAGADATSARVVGNRDLRFGVDLRENRWLRIAVDGRPAREFSCAGSRPHATTFEDIVAAITAELPGVDVTGAPTALTITSQSAGSGSRIAFEPVRAADAMDLIFGREPGEVRGADAGTVAFIGTADLAKGVEVAPGASVKIGVDAITPVEIVLNTGEAPLRRMLSEIVSAVNQALQGAFASHDSRVVTLTSRARGEASRLVFEVPDGVDVTRAVFGIPAPRVYQASEARPAEIRSTKPLPEELELSARRFLRISVDGGPPTIVDCGIAASDPANPKPTPEEIRTAINTAINGLTHLDERTLILRSRTVGSAGRVALQPLVAGDARALVFGSVPDATRGLDGTPAEIVGEVSHAKPLDFLEHHHVSLSVDGGRAIEIDVAGPTPGQTTLDEVVEAINQTFPALASKTPDRQLRLRAPSAGTASTLGVVPRRFVELVEFPPVEDRLETGPITHGTPITVHNTGVAEAHARLEITSLHGTVAPSLVNHRAGRRVTLDLSMRPGERAVVEPADKGPRVTLFPRVGDPRVLEDEEVRLEDVAAEPTDDLLVLGRGTTAWTFSDAVGPRFDSTRFDAERYPATPGRSVGTFDVSRYAGADEHGQSMFAPVPLPPASSSVQFTWLRHQGGAFELRLPAELPVLFGGRFNEARFGIDTEEKTVEIAEVDRPPTVTTARVNKRAALEGVVFSPESDPDHIIRKFESDHPLLEVSAIRTNVPLGFVAQQAPFRQPRFLALGELDGRARLFLTEADSDELIELIAPEAGVAGTRLSVSARPDGPGRYLVEVGFDGDRFECGRSLVLGPPIEAVTTAAPGILRAKAAGVQARVTRDGTAPSE